MSIFETEPLRSRKPGPLPGGRSLADGREYHFRPGFGGHEATSIHVKDGYRNGKTVAELNDTEAIWNFFAGLA